MKKSKNQRGKDKETTKSPTMQLIKEIAKAEGIISAIGDGISILDRTFTILYENKIHVDSMGDHVGEHCYKAYQKREGVCDGCPMALTFKDGKVHTVQRELHTDKGTRYFEIASSPLQDTKGKIIAGIEVVRDITERKRVEETLKEQEGLYRTFINSTSDMVFLKDEQLRNIIVNKAFLEFLGAGEDQVIGKTDFELLSESVAEGCRQTDMEALESEDVVMTEEQNGDRIVETRKFRVYLRDKTFGIGGYIRDITDRKKAEEALKERKKELEIQTKNLEEANVALKVLLRRTDEDRAELEEKVLLNVRELVIPYLKKLKISSIDETQRTFVDILESNLLQITSPFSQRMSSQFLNFTPTEIQVADLLRKGKTSKEIGELLNASPRAITFHRENIRKKLGLKNKKANLKSYLLSLK